MPGAQRFYLVRKLRSHVLLGVAKKKNKPKVQRTLVGSSMGKETQSGYLMTLGVCRAAKGFNASLRPK